MHDNLLPAASAGETRTGERAAVEVAMTAAAKALDIEPVLFEALDGGVLRLALNRPTARCAPSVG